MAEELELLYPYGRTIGELAISSKLWSQLPTVPNILSILRAIVGSSLQVFLMVLAPNTWWPVLNFLLWALTDMLDGYLAKHHNMGTVLGKILDPLADKLFVILTLIGLAVQRMLAVLGAIPYWGQMSSDGQWLAVFWLQLVVCIWLIAITTFTVVRDVRVTKLRLTAALPSGQFESARQAGRVKMVVQSAVIIFFQLPFASFVPDATWLVVVLSAELVLLGVVWLFTWSSWLDYKHYHAVID